MALVHGDNVIVKVPGAGLSLSSEACTEVSGTVFQITNAAKRVLDPTAAVVVKSAGVTIAADLYTLDRLLGTITFDSTQTGLTVIVFSGTYLPMSAAATATSVKFSLKKNNGSVDVLNGGGWAKREGLLWDCSGSLARFEEADAYYADAITAGTPIVVEQSLNGSLHCRAWALLSNDDIEAAADAFVEGSIEWEGTPDAEGNVISFA